MPVQQFGELLSNRKKLTFHILTLVLIAAVVSITSMIFFDQHIAQYWAGDGAKLFIKPWAREITNAALSEHYFAIALFAWIFCKWIGPRIKSLKPHSARLDFFRRWGLNLLVALLVSGAMTHVVKFLVGRQRPHKSETFEAHVFDPITTHWHWHSFSSGHSQVIFTAAVMFSIAFPKLRWMWLAFAVILCATRVIGHDHFLSDTIFGATVGYVGTLLALKLMKEKTRNGLY